MVETESTRSASAQPVRLAGLLLALFGVLLVGAIARHPSVGSVARAELLPQIVHLAPLDRLVHAVVIAVAIGLLTSLSVFSSRRRNLQNVASSALIVYGVAVGGTIVAAMVDGFLVPGIAERYADAPPEGLNAALVVLHACALVIQIATKLSLIATAVAILLWSVTLMNGSTRIAGILGVASALASAFVLAVTGTLNPHNLGAIVLLQSLWYVCVGVLMAKGRL